MVFRTSDVKYFYLRFLRDKVLVSQRNKAIYFRSGLNDIAESLLAILCKPGSFLWLLQKYNVFRDIT
jgi:hypothetical protein